MDPTVLGALEGPGQVRANNALTGFLLLGPLAAPAVTNLVRLSYRPPQSWTSARAIATLGNIGECALPALEQILSDPKHPNRGPVLDLLEDMFDRGLNVAHAEPTLKQCLHDPSQSIATAAARTLDRLLAEAGARQMHSAPATTTSGR